LEISEQLGKSREGLSGNHPAYPFVCLASNIPETAACLCKGSTVTGSMGFCRHGRERNPKMVYKMRFNYVK
jgi:hypothetical protein